MGEKSDDKGRKLPVQLSQLTLLSVSARLLLGHSEGGHRRTKNKKMQRSSGPYGLPKRNVQQHLRVHTSATRADRGRGGRPDFWSASLAAFASGAW